MTYYHDLGVMSSNAGRVEPAAGGVLYFCLDPKRENVFNNHEKH